jgi:hypothetical protein
MTSKQEIKEILRKYTYTKAYLKVNGQDQKKKEFVRMCEELYNEFTDKKIQESNYFKEFYPLAVSFCRLKKCEKVNELKFTFEGETVRKFRLKYLELKYCNIILN